MADTCAHSSWLSLLVLTAPGAAPPPRCPPLFSLCSLSRSLCGISSVSSSSGATAQSIVPDLGGSPELVNSGASYAVILILISGNGIK